jgi:hypothetical protein
MMEFDLAKFAKFVAEELNDNVHEARKEALEVGAKMIEAEAKHVIGTHLFDWPPLAESTKADRVAKGFAEDEPLLRTGETRDSIGHTIVVPGEYAEIGSNNDKAVWQELGTATIQSRSFLAASAFYKAKEVANVTRSIVGVAVAGRSIAGEIAKIAAEALRDLGQTALDMVEDQKQDRETR